MPAITRPTKVNLDCLTTRISVLDQIWVSEGIRHFRSFVLPMDLTDHFPVCLAVENTMIKNIPSTTQI